MDLPYYVASKLGGAKKTKNGWRCKCPVHDDHDPSLYLSSGDKQELIVKCQAGCDQMIVFNYIKDAGLLPELKKADKKPPKQKTEVARYHYTNSDGEVLFEKVRYEPKSFASFYYDEKGNRTPGSNGKSKTLYLLHTLKDLKDKRVVIVEGEKDCDYVVNNYGILCTSPPNGAGSWCSSFNETFHHAEVIICPDNDRAGKEFAEKVKSELSSIAKKVTIVNVPTGKDISDWQGDLKQFNELIESEKILLFSNADELGKNCKPTNYLINGILETDSHGMLAGSSGAFKSFMALALAHSICNGVDFFGYKSFGAHKVVYVCGEGKGALARRIRAVQLVYGDFNNNMYVLDEKISIDKEEDIKRINIGIQEVRPALVIFDTFSSMNSQTNENDNSEVSNLLSMITKNISNGFTSTMIVHHFGKASASGVRGASAFTANSDYVMAMERQGKEYIATLSCFKTKDGEMFDDIDVIAEAVPIGIEAQDGCETTSLILRRAGIFEAVKKMKHSDVFMNLYSEMIEQFPTVVMLGGNKFVGVDAKEFKSQAAKRSGCDKSDKSFLMAFGRFKDARLSAIDSIFVLKNNEVT